MARYTVGTRSTGPGSTTLPIGSLFAVASRSAYVREVGVFNTTTTAYAVRLARMSAVGTPGSGLTEEKYHPTDDTPDMTAFDTHTVTGTIATGNLRVAAIGAAVGAGVIWTFAEPGLYIPAGTSNGIAILVATGTGQISDWYMEWDE